MILGIIHTHSTNTAVQVMHQSLQPRDVTKQLNLNMSNVYSIIEMPQYLQSKNNVKELVKTETICNKLLHVL